MTKERKRKHAHVEVQGELPVEERIPRWELELLVAAFARIGVPVIEDEHAAQ